jgi:hypothetical protein
MTTRKIGEFPEVEAHRIIGLMAKIEDIPQMTIEELRPLVQRALGLDEWPVSDWIVVGIIFDEAVIHVDRASNPAYSFSVVISGKGIGHGLGTEVDTDPVTAIFRAYLDWRCSVARLDKKGGHF